MRVTGREKQQVAQPGGTDHQVAQPGGTDHQVTSSQKGVKDGIIYVIPKLTKASLKVQKLTGEIRSNR